MHPDGKNYHSVRMVNSASAIDTEYQSLLANNQQKWTPRVVELLG